MLNLHKFASMPGNGTGHDDKGGNDNQDTGKSVG